MGRQQRAQLVAGPESKGGSYWDLNQSENTDITMGLSCKVKDTEVGHRKTA